MSRIRLVAIDIDGTIPDPERGSSPRVVAAVRRALRCGVIVTLATGRRYRAALPVAERLGIVAPLIIANGSAVIEIPPDAGARAAALDPRRPVRPIFEKNVPERVALRALRAMERCGHEAYVYGNLGRGQLIYHRLGRGRAARTLPWNPSEYLAMPRLEEACRPDPMRLLAVGPEASKGDLLDRLARLPEVRVVPWSGGDTVLIEVLDRTCSKAAALDALARHLHLRRGEVAAIGDNANDVEMLRYAAIGVVVEGASDEAVAAADYVAPPCEEDGVAVALDALCSPEFDPVRSGLEPVTRPA